MSKGSGVQQQFPEGMVPLGGESFRFSCHPGVSCYMKCCRNVDMLLYPYDIILLKNKLQIRSDEFLEKYIRVGQGSNPYFPALMMKMDSHNACPFLGPDGCTVYEVRPAACRTYPLERAVDRTARKGRAEEFYFLTNHDYCKGHAEDKMWTVKEWLRDQKLLIHNSQADRWAEMDSFFATNPWAGEGVAGPKQKLAFMVVYNLDSFRDYMQHHNILGQFKMAASRVRAIERDDEALLSFGYDWLQFVLAGKPTLKQRKKR
ncbi:MAG: YkgJ family cysteine cluster protein [Thermodesulfobacteriota bacterium]